VKIFTQKTSGYYLVGICAIIIISSLLPWVDIGFVFSPLEIGLAVFFFNEGNIQLFQIQMLLVPLIPVILIFLVVLERALKRKISWIIYLISGGVIVYISAFNKVVGINELIENNVPISIGHGLGILGSSLLCLFSATVKRMVDRAH
jgi:hypothetical protein